MSALTDILGSLLQTGMSQSSSKRMKKTLGAGSPIDFGSLSEVFGGKSGTLSDILRSAKKKTSSAGMR